MRLTNLLLLSVAMGLAACGTDAIRRPSTTPSPSEGAPQSGPAAGAQGLPEGPRWQAVSNPYLDPRLDSIRDKVPLQLRSGAVTATHLSNDKRPTREEKRAIKVWQEVREKAHQGRPQPSALLTQTRLRVTRAITQLYAGQLTYGDFARRVQEIDALHRAANRQRLGQQN